MSAYEDIWESERQTLLRPSSSSSPPSSSHDVVATTTGEDKTTLPQRCWRCIKNYTPIEVMLFGYTFCRVVVIFLTQFYFYDQASHWYGDPSMSSLNPCGKNRSHPTALASKVKKTAVELDMLASFTGFLPAVIPAIFLGPAMDVLGRRIGFILPLLGTICRALVFLFVNSLNASVYFMYLGTVLEGLGGGFGSFLMTSFSAAADVTTPGPQRGLRICIIEAVNVFASSLAGFVSGFWRESSYEQPVIFCAALGIVWLILGLWVMPETLHSVSTQNEHPHDKHSGESSSQEVASTRRQQQNDFGTNAVGVTDDGFVSCSIQGRESVSDLQPSLDFTESGSSYNSTKIARSSVPSPPVSPDPTSPVRFHDRRRYVPQTSRTLFRDESCDSFVCSNSNRNCIYGASDVGGISARSAEIPAPSETSGAQISRTVTQTSRQLQRSGSHPDTHGACCGRALSKVGRSFKVYCRVVPEVPARQSILALCFVAFLLTVAVNFSKPNLETVYRMGTLCWNAVKETEFDSGWLIAHWVCILIALHVLQKRLGVSDVYVAMIGCVSGIAAPAIFAFADTDALVFISAASGTMARALIPMLRSMASAVVDVDEQGALFASYACVELAGAAVFALAFGKLNTATADIWSGIVFLVLAAIMVIVFLLLVVLARVLQRHQVRGTHTSYGSTAERE